MISWMGLLEASVAGGICIILFSFASQLCGQRYWAKYKKIIWFLIALRLCIPVSSLFISQPFTVQVPVYVLGNRENRQITDVENNAIINGSVVGSEGLTGGTIFDKEPGHDGSYTDAGINSRLFTSQDILLILWSCGSIVTLLYYLLSHLVFSHKMMKESENCTNKSIVAATIRMSKELGLKKVPQVRMIKDVRTGPFTMGFLNNIIVLPDVDYQGKDLQYIIKHELIHCANKDTQLKAVFVIINSIHWFNPLVWFMRAMVYQEMELECDEKVLSAATNEERNEYSEVLMSCIGTGRAGRSALSTSYVPGVKFIKKRFRNIFNMQKKSGRAAACIMVALLIVASGIIGFETGRTVYAKSGIAIDYGIELRTDVTGNSLIDRVTVYDNNDVLITSVELVTADGRFAQISYREDLWASSYLVSGDLSGNGAADIVLMRISFGMHCVGPVSVLHVIDGEEPDDLMWQEYSNRFIPNSSIDVDQPGTFDDIACLDATIIEKNGKHLLRLIALDLEILDDDTVQCIDCSLQDGGWYIEDMFTVTGYLTEDKKEELLVNNIFYLQ